MEERYRQQLDELEFSAEAKARMIAAVAAAANDSHTSDEVSSPNVVSFENKPRSKKRMNRALYPAAAVVAVMLVGFVGFQGFGQLSEEPQEAAVSQDFSTTMRVEPTSKESDSVDLLGGVATRNEFNIVLPCTEEMGTAQWEIKIENDGVLQVSEPYQQENDLGYGGTQNEVFTFVPIGEGETTVEFYLQSDQNGVYDISAPSYTYVFEVDANLQAVVTSSSCSLGGPFVALDPEYLE